MEQHVTMKGTYFRANALWTLWDKPAKQVSLARTSIYKMKIHAFIQSLFYVLAVPNPCKPNPCKRGECEVVGNRYSCRCPPAYGGPECQYGKCEFCTSKIFASIKEQCFTHRNTIYDLHKQLNNDMKFKTSVVF